MEGRDVYRLCISHFRTNFSQLVFHVVTKSCNLVVKLMAGYVKEKSEPSIWLEEDLSILLPIVL